MSTRTGRLSTGPASADLGRSSPPNELTTNWLRGGPTRQPNLAPRWTSLPMTAACCPNRPGTDPTFRTTNCGLVDHRVRRCLWYGPTPSTSNCEGHYSTAGCSIHLRSRSSAINGIRLRLLIRYGGSTTSAGRCRRGLCCVSRCRPRPSCAGRATDGNTISMCAPPIPGSASIMRTSTQMRYRPRPPSPSPYDGQTRIVGRALTSPSESFPVKHAKTYQGKED